MTAGTALLVAQAVASGAMAGIAWFVQVVHYPLFGAVPAAGSADYARTHRRRTPWVVVPPMAVEALASVALAAAPPPGIGRPAAVAGLVLVVLLALSTALVQMPLHDRLGREGCTRPLVDRLVATSWLRTIGWSARALLAAWMLHAAGR